MDELYKGHGGAQETPRLKRGMEAAKGQAMANRGKVESGKKRKKEQRGPRGGAVGHPRAAGWWG